MASLTCCLDMHDDDYLGLSMNEQFVNFGVPKKKFKKATAKEVKKNAKHVRELKRRWETEVRDKLDNPENDCQKTSYMCIIETLCLLIIE